MKKLLLLTFVVLTLFPDVNSQSPYKLSWGKESLILGTGLITAIAGSAIDDKVLPMTEAEVGQLNRADVNFFDRSATDNYSASIAKTSDYLLYSCIASPGYPRGGSCRINYRLFDSQVA